MAMIDFPRPKHSSTLAYIRENGKKQTQNSDFFCGQKCAIEEPSVRGKSAAYYIPWRYEFLTLLEKKKKKKKN